MTALHLVSPTMASAGSPRPAFGAVRLRLGRRLRFRRLKIVDGMDLLVGCARLEAARTLYLGKGDERRRTSLRLEVAFMDTLEAIAVAEGISFADLVTRIDIGRRAVEAASGPVDETKRRQEDNLSRALRVYALNYALTIRRQATISDPGAVQSGC